MLTAPDTPSIESPLEGGQTYYGVLIWFVDVGTQETTYKGKTKHMRQVVMTFEFPEVTITDDKGEEAPVVRSMNLTFSMAETANLRKHIERWYGKQFESDEQALKFDFNHIMGRCAALDILLSKKGKPFIDSIRKTPKKDYTPYNPLIIWGFDMGEPIPETLPDWIKKLIMQSKEWNEQGQQNEGPPSDYEQKQEPDIDPDFGTQYSETDDDIPF